MELLETVKQDCSAQITDTATRAWFISKLTFENASSFYLAFGMINRKVERLAIRPSDQVVNILLETNPSFDRQDWTLDEYCRLVLLLSLPVSINHQTIKTLLSTADIKEQVSIYKSIQFLPNPEDFVLQVIDGIRTNMVDVFDAIALKNAFPFRYFEESSWNQMVLKAIFMERPIFKIFGIDDRRNEQLTGILHDFAHERWSAHRRVTPELWRLVVHSINAEVFDDLKQAFSDDSVLDKQAVINAINQSDFEPAKNWLKEQDLPASSMTWDEIGETVFSENEH